MKRKQRLVRPLGQRVVLALVLVSLLLAGCARPLTGEPEPEPVADPVRAAETLIYTTPGDATILLPTLTRDTASSFVTGLVYDGLAVYDDQLNPHPALAESWEVTDDRIYTFKLRQGVKFHDGAPLTARDVVFTYLTIAHPKYQGVRFGDFVAIKGWQELADAYELADHDLEAGQIDEKMRDAKKMAAYQTFVRTGGLQAPDPYTFRVEAAYPFAPLFTRLTGYGIMPRHLLEPDIGDLENSPYASRPVGTGSMRLVDWVKDEQITLERNPDWHYSASGQGAQIERLIIRIGRNQQENMAALEAGQIDMADITPEMYEHFRSQVPDVKIYNYATFAYTFLGYNHRHPIFADRRVRQAITQAIDRQEMVNQLLLGHGAPAHSHASPARWDYNPDIPVFPFSQEEAARLLDEAGWRLGPDGVRQKDGQRLTIEIAVNVESHLRSQAADYIKEALKLVGIEVGIKRLEWRAFLDYVEGDLKEAYLLGWSLGFDPDPHSIFHSKGGFQPLTGYVNSEVDELIIQGRSTTDQAKRKEIYGRLQALLAQEQVYTWLFVQDSIVGVNQRVQGVKHGSPNGLMWNWEEWRIVEP